LDAIAGLEKEEKDRKNDLGTFWKNKNAGNELALKYKKYKEAITAHRKNYTLTKIPQALKDGIKVTIDSITVLLGAQDLEGEITKAIGSVKNLVTAKGSLPGFEGAVQKTQSLIANLTDPKKIQELNSATDKITDIELKRAITQSKANLLMMLESTNSRSQKLGNDILCYGRIIDHSEIIEKISAFLSVTFFSTQTSGLKNPLSSHFL
jgi:hypothetical protein